MARILLALIFASLFVVGAPAGGLIPQSGGIGNNAAATAMEFRRLKSIPPAKRNMNEDFLLGIAYYEGLPEAGVVRDPERAREHFLAAYGKGYELGAIHVLLADIRANAFDRFLDDANRFLAENISPGTKRKILVVVSDHMVEAGRMKLAEPYLKILADFFKDPGASISLAVIYREGLDGRAPNQAMANNYLTKGCRNPLANESIRSFCEQFRK